MDVMVEEEAGELKNWGERKVEVVVVVAAAVVEAGYVTGSTEKMENTFAQVVQSGKEVVAVDMQTLVVVEVDMMQTVDWEQGFQMEPHNHPVESSN